MHLRFLRFSINTNEFSLTTNLWDRPVLRAAELAMERSSVMLHTIPEAEQYQDESFHEYKWLFPCFYALWHHQHERYKGRMWAELSLFLYKPSWTRVVASTLCPFSHWLDGMYGKVLPCPCAGGICWDIPLILTPHPHVVVRGNPYGMMIPLLPGCHFIFPTYEFETTDKQINTNSQLKDQCILPATQWNMTSHPSKKQL